MKHALILGASGVVGFAALKHFSSLEGWRVTACSRRAPLERFGASFIAADLLDRELSRSLFSGPEGVTHLVYAALDEKPGLTAGWVDPGQIARNETMLRNVLDPLLEHGTRLQHVTLLQGAKAYGAHVRPIPIPAREGRDEARGVPNFYWAQEDYLRERQRGSAWSWTILRPQVIFGEAIGAAMNPIPAIGAYAAILQSEGQRLHFPGGVTAISEAVDADLLAEVIGWAGRCGEAANQVFNVTNGDVFQWESVWPIVAECVGMEVGSHVPGSVAADMPRRSAQWDTVRTRYGLTAPPLADFVGQSFHYLDLLFGYGRDAAKPPSILSTIKLRRAGFCGAIDTEEMLRRLFRSFQERRLLPPA